MNWLISMFTGGMGGYLITAGVAALLAGAVAGYSVHKLDQIPLAEARQATLQAQNEFAAYQTKIAGDAAVANAKALSDRLALEAKNTQIEADLAKSKALADAKSAQLRKILDAAAPQDIRLLGPSALNYVAGVRAAQAASAPNH